MTQYGTWVSYSGTAEVALAGVLAVAAAGAAYAGARLPLPTRLAMPGKTARAILLTLWPVSIVAFLAGFSIYAAHAHKVLHLAKTTPPADPIDPVSVICFGVILCFVALAYNARGWRIALGSAVIGALAGWMIFEFPFDLIIMARTYPPLPPDPALYRAVFFAPLLLVELTTLARLTLSPVVRPSRATFWCFAAMLAVFAIWALVGFGYPASPAPLALNVVSKILAFATALTLFLPELAHAEPAATPAQEAKTPMWTSVM